MRTVFVACSVLVVSMISAVSSIGQDGFVNTLMPQPENFEAASGSGIAVTPQLAVALDAVPSDPLRAAAMRMIKRLQDETGIAIAGLVQSEQNASMIIQVSDVTHVRPALEADESYRLDVAGGVVRIQAPSLFGAYHAMETLIQLVQSAPSGFFIPCVHIEDAPRFPWRGLLLDPGRRFLPVSTVLRTLDGMAAVKMNVLHFQLSENQGFRLESKRFPKLQEQESNGQFYSQAEMRQIIAYAAARGIRVVPEFDMPGHSTSWLVGYPELASGSGPYHIEQTFGVFDAAMDPTRESTYRFLDEFFHEITQVFPDEYVHIGGDETNGKEWAANPAIQRFMKSHGIPDAKALQGYFNKRVQAILKKNGRKMVGWDEILHPDLSPDVAVQNWHGTEFLINSARQKHQGLYSQPYYLDHTYSAAQMYTADPIPDGAGLTPAEEKRILGGEACMWGEMVGPETVDSRIWPRTAAVAERLWSPRKTRDVADMYRRLDVESLRLDPLTLEQISGPQRLLRAIADEVATPALNVLAATLEPEDFSGRSRHQHLTQTSPLTNMVDAVVPDPPLEHRLSGLVETYLRDADGTKRAAAREQLVGLFQTWLDSAKELARLEPTHPRLQPLAARSKELAQLGEIGLSAIDAREHKNHGVQVEDATAASVMDQAGKPDESLTVFVVLKQIRELIEAKK